MKTDSAGNEINKTVLDGGYDDFGYSVEVTADGGFIFVGATASYGNGETDAYLVKTDPFGNFEWDHAYGGADVGDAADSHVASPSRASIPSALEKQQQQQQK